MFFIAQYSIFKLANSEARSLSVVEKFYKRLRPLLRKSYVAFIEKVFKDK